MKRVPLSLEAPKKPRKIDTVASTNEFHEKGIKLIITASVAEISQAFNSSELPVTLDPKSYPDTKSEEFQTYRNDSLRILYNYYGSDASNKFQGRLTKSDRLLKSPYDTLQLEFGGLKTYVNKQNIKIKEENSKRFSFTKSKLKFKTCDKYSTKKSIDMLEKELEHLNTKIENPFLVEDLLRDIAVGSAFPNVPLLLIIYLLVTHTGAVVKAAFQKWAKL